MKGKKKSKLELIQEKAQAAINKTNDSIEELGKHTSCLYDSLTSIQDLFDKILLEAMVYEQIDESHLASELSDEERSLFYQIISLDLPDTASSQEINDLVSIFSNEMEQIKFEELIQQLATAEKAGNKERVLELTLQIINQKKKL